MADYIRVEDLKNTTISIKKESERINDIYTNNIVKALENSQTELKVAGVNYDESKTGSGFQPSSSKSNK